MFIDHDIINSIIKNTNFNIISINRINCRLTNVSIYLSIYSLNVYYIFGRFKLILNVLLHFRILKDNVVRTDNKAEPAFNAI